jgi:hypothetical protein
VKSSDQKIVSSATILRTSLSCMRKISIRMEKQVNTIREIYRFICINNNGKYQFFNQYNVVLLMSVHITVQ